MELLDMILAHVGNLLQTDYGLFVIIFILAVGVFASVYTSYRGQVNGLIKSALLKIADDYKGKHGELSSEILLNKVIEHILHRLEDPKYSFKFKPMLIALIKVPIYRTQLAKVINKLWYRYTGNELS